MMSSILKKMDQERDGMQMLQYDPSAFYSKSMSERAEDSAEVHLLLMHYLARVGFPVSHVAQIDTELPTQIRHKTTFAARIKIVRKRVRVHKATKRYSTDSTELIQLDEPQDDLTVTDEELIEVLPVLLMKHIDTLFAPTNHRLVSLIADFGIVTSGDETGKVVLTDLSNYNSWRIGPIPGYQPDERGREFVLSQTRALIKFCLYGSAVPYVASTSLRRDFRNLLKSFRRLTYSFLYKE